MALIKSISGIRGTLGGNPGDVLTPVDIVKFTAAFGTWLKQKKRKNSVVIGRDARPSGEAIGRLVSATLQNLGFDVIDLALSTTPTVEMATSIEKAAGGIVITASHNPVQWNALKLLNHDGEFISAADGATILQLAEKNKFDFVPVGQLGGYQRVDQYIAKHIALVKAYPLVEADIIRKAKFKIVVDAVNSTGGIAVPELLKVLGVKVIEKIYCHPDGRFAHNPEPLPQHLGAISKRVKSKRYDLGIAVDPDVDRLALIQEDGTPFGEEYTLVAVADYMLKRKKGSVVSNLSSTRALKDIAAKAQCRYYASAVGEVNVVKKMKKVKAVIGGEGNGGVIVPDFHYGRDALIAIALFLTYLAKMKIKMSELKKMYPAYYISKNKIELTPQIDVDRVLKEMELKYNTENISTIDGVRIDFEKKKEWVHLRKSNTEPIIRIYAESQSKRKASTLAKKIIRDIHTIAKTKTIL